MTLDSLSTIAGATAVGVVLAHVLVTLYAGRRPTLTALLVLLGTALATVGFALTARSSAHLPLVGTGVALSVGSLFIRRRARDGT